MRTPVALPPYSNREQRHVQAPSFQAIDIHQGRARRVREKARVKASGRPPGTEREEVLKKARQADTASHMDDWANSPDLQASRPEQIIARTPRWNR
jgi:hypothetical protein